MTIDQERIGSTASQNTPLDPSTSSREDSDTMMIRVPADEATEEQVKRARDEYLTRATILVRQGHLEAADRLIGEARQLERKHIDDCTSLNRGVNSR